MQFVGSRWRLGIKLSQRLVEKSSIEESHSPHVGGGDGSHPKEFVVVRADVGAGHHTPLVAIPVFGECLLVGVAHGPDIVGGDAGHPVEVVDRPGARAGDDGPGGSLCHRWCQEQGDQHRSDQARKETDFQTIHDTPLKLLLSQRAGHFAAGRPGPLMKTRFGNVLLSKQGARLVSPTQAYATKWYSPATYRRSSPVKARIHPLTGNTSGGYTSKSTGT